MLLTGWGPLHIMPLYHALLPHCPCQVEIRITVLNLHAHKTGWSTRHATPVLAPRGRGGRLGRCDTSRARRGGSMDVRAGMQCLPVCSLPGYGVSE